MKPDIRFNDLTDQQMGAVKRKIYRYIESHPNSTSRDVIQARIVSADAVHKRLSELYNAGWIINMGVKRYDNNITCRMYQVVSENPKPIMKWDMTAPTMKERHVLMLKDAIQGKPIGKDWSSMVIKGRGIFNTITDKGYSISVHEEEDGIRHCEVHLYSGVFLILTDVQAVALHRKFKKATMKGKDYTIEIMTK